MRLSWRYGLTLITVALALILTSTLKNYPDITPLFFQFVVGFISYLRWSLM